MDINNNLNELANRKIENLAPPKKPPVLRRDHLALNAILAVQPVVRINSVDQPQIQLPLVEVLTSASDCPLRPPKFYALSHPRVRAEIADLVQRETGLILHEQQITRLLIILEGMAWKSPLMESELERMLDESPLIEAIYLLLKHPENNSQFHSSGAQLLEELQIIGKRKWIDLKSKDWPRSASILSRRLQEMKTQLQDIGITVEIGRKGGGDRYVNLTLDQRQPHPTCCDDTDDLPSQEPTPSNQIGGPKLGETDESDDDLLLKMKHILSNKY